MLTFQPLLMAKINSKDLKTTASPVGLWPITWNSEASWIRNSRSKWLLRLTVLRSGNASIVIGRVALNHGIWKAAKAFWPARILTEHWTSRQRVKSGMFGRLRQFILLAPLGYPAGRRRKNPRRTVGRAFAARNIIAIARNAEKLTTNGASQKRTARQNSNNSEGSAHEIDSQKILRHSCAWTPLPIVIDGPSLKL